MARTGKRYHDKLAAETRTNTQIFAKTLFINQQFNQWVHYNNKHLGKLVIIDRCGQVSYESAEPSEPHKLTDPSLHILLLPLEETTTFGLIINSYLSSDLQICLLDFLLLFTFFSLPMFHEYLVKSMDYLFLRN